MTETTTTPPSVPSGEERAWAAAAHVAPLIGLTWIAPLVIWIVKKDESSFLDDQGREALNFQITVFLLGIVFLVLVFVCIGVPLLIGLGIVDLILGIVAGIRASEGKRYRYPICLRIL